MIETTRTYRVGELARLTGVSVRALRHYDEIGLLHPCERAPNGYRLYDARDIARLQSIQSLRSLGFSLAEIGECLNRHVLAPTHILELHIARLQERIAAETRLCARLETVRAALQEKREVSVEQLLGLIEEINMTEKYYTPEQLEQLQQRAETVGADRIQEVEAAWPILMDEVRAAIERGDDPHSESSRELARRWNGLVEEFTGGDAGIRASLNTMYENESNVHGLDVAAMKPLFEFIGRASETE